jgi:FtsH-binding integral membrane protein
MKTNNLLYILSLVVLLGSIILAVEYQDSGRIQFIAGILTMVGLGMNIVGYTMKKQ